MSRAPVMIGRLRLATGLVLFTFVSCHLLNHAFGLVSVDAMEAAHDYLMTAWRTLPGTALLAAAAVVHFGLALRSILVRRTLRLPRWEWAQMLLGLAIPALLLEHVLGTRYFELAYGVEPSYIRTLVVQWVLAPVYLIMQPAAVVVAWAHGCIGLHFWLRTKAGYARWRGVLLGVAVAVPSAALAGFVAAGNAVMRAVDEGDLFPEDLFQDAGVDPADVAAVQSLYAPGYTAIAALVLLPFIYRLGRRLARSLSRTNIVRLPNGREYPIEPGGTLLETLRSHGVPHASVCGGRARCTTCRVRVTEGLEALDPPSSLEAAALARIDAPESTRLACQIRPGASIAVLPLLPPDASARDGRRPGGLEGQERVVTCLFVDLRGSTKLAEERLPYDVLFILNQFFAEMNEAITGTGGHYAQFNGDGLMALYGLDAADPARGARRALRGAGEMLRRLEKLNVDMHDELRQPLKVGIGIHTGDAIVGIMGPPKGQTTTAIGDTINTTARLEGLTKEHGVSLIVSEDTIGHAGAEVGAAKRQTITVRGRTRPIGFFALEDVPPLP